MLSLKENNNRQLDVEMSGLVREKNEAMEAARRMEVKMNQAMHQAKLQLKEKCMEVFFSEPLQSPYGSIWLRSLLVRMGTSFARSFGMCFRRFR